MIKKISFTALILLLPVMISAVPIVEYRMDECFWLNNTNGLTGDVKDSGLQKLDATSYNTASIDTTSGVLNFSGQFHRSDDNFDTDHVDALNFTDQFTITFWVKQTNLTRDQAYVSKYTQNPKAGWSIFFKDQNPYLIRFRVRIGNNFRNLDVTTPADWTDGNWHFVAAVYDGSAMKLYIDESEPTGTLNATGNITNTTTPLQVGIRQNSKDFEGNLDEVKIWNVALTNGEVDAIYTNEGSGSLNYDGTPREPVTCEATAEANSWTMIGIPIDLRTDPKSVTETFQGMTGTYGTDWRVYRRDYSDANNSSWYTYLDNPDTNMTEFGKGYLLGNALDTNETWNVDGTQAVDYDSAQAGCPANQCVEIDIKSASLDSETGDDLLGTGPYRYNMSGFTGKSPVSWADCRFIIGGTVYTPTEAENAGYASKVIWQYNPGPGADSNGYTSCDDTTPGTCLLEPYKGFCVELHGPTKNLPVKLLIPQE